MDDTEIYESKFDVSLSDSELNGYAANNRRKYKHKHRNPKEFFDVSQSGSRLNIYRIKEKDPLRKNQCSPQKKPLKHNPCQYYETGDNYDDESECKTPLNYKYSVGGMPGGFTAGTIVPTIPYQANDNYGNISRGDLVFVDPEGEVRSLYNVPSPQTVREFDGLRFISASHSLDRFQMIRTMNIMTTSGSIKTKVILEQVNEDGTEINNREISDITGRNVNFAIDSINNISYVVGDNMLWAFDAGNRTLLRKMMPVIKSEAINVVAAREESVYSGGVVTVPGSLNDISLSVKTGYISHITLVGNLAQLVAVKATNLEFRGMYYFNNRLYITARYKGQMYLTKPLVPGDKVNFDNPDNVEKIAVNMCDMTSVIIALDDELRLIWWRVLVSDNPNKNFIGDITCNQFNQIFTTCRFRGTLGMSEYNSIETDKSITREDEAFVIIGLSGEFPHPDCPEIAVPSGISRKPTSWWRMIPAGFPNNNVSNYISMDNNTYDIIISGYTDVSLSDKFVISNHYFFAGFSPRLFDLYYHPIVENVNRYNSRIIAVSSKAVITGSTAWNNLYVFPFGMLKSLLNQTGYYMIFSLDFPKLIGIVVNRCHSDDDNEVDVQFSGYTSVYQDAKVGRNYYITCAPTTKTQPKLTTNNGGCSKAIGQFGSARYYGAAVKDEIIHIAGYN